MTATKKKKKYRVRQKHMQWKQSLVYRWKIFCGKVFNLRLEGHISIRKKIS